MYLYFMDDLQGLRGHNTSHLCSLIMIWLSPFNLSSKISVFGWVAFPRKMVDAAFDWAAKHNLIRRSPIHQEEEAKIILGDSFALKTEEGEESSRTGNMTCEEPRLTH